MPWPADEVERRGPLAGLRVLDLSRILAGPFATQVLADLGADVIKVERAGMGDETRRWGPPWTESGDAAYFFACNRGRRSVALDLTAGADREVVLGLAEDADVLLENFLPGAMERLGLDDGELSSRNPRLVHGVISGYGHATSRGTWPALDFVVQAHAGILSITGPDAATQVKAGVPVADLTAGLYAAVGVLAAVREAQRTGRGRRVEISLAEACASLLSNHAINHLLTGTEPRARGNTHPSLAPYQSFHAQDKELALAASSEAQFERLARVLGLPELAADPRFATNKDRVAHRDELAAILDERLRTRPAADWVRELNAAGVAAAPVNSVGELLGDPDTRAGLVAELPDGTPQVRTPIRLDGAPLPLSAAPPAMGEHTGAIRAAATRAPVAEGVAAADVLAALDAIGATHVVVVPDTSQRTVLEALDARADRPVVRMATESDVLGVCAGLWISGHRPVAIVQQLGLFAAANALRTYRHDQRLPLPVVAGLYGREPDRPVAASRASAVRLARPLLDALEIRHALIEGPGDAAGIAPALAAAFEECTVSVVLLGAPTT